MEPSWALLVVQPIAGSPARLRWMGWVPSSPPAPPESKQLLHIRPRGFSDSIFAPHIFICNFGRHRGFHRACHVFQNKPATQNSNLFFKLARKPCDQNGFGDLSMLPECAPPSRVARVCPPNRVARVWPPNRFDFPCVCQSVHPQLS